MTKIIPREMRKETITIRIPKYIISKLREIKGYNNLIERLLVDYFNKSK